jgi:hypothetical protein
MDWQPIKTAPPRARVLICDDAERVQIGRSTGLRWFDDAGQPSSRHACLVDAVPETAAKAVATSAADARNKALRSTFVRRPRPSFFKPAIGFLVSVSAILTGVLAMASHLP